MSLTHIYVNAELIPFCLSTDDMLMNTYMYMYMYVLHVAFLISCTTVLQYYRGGGGEEGVAIMSTIKVLLFVKATILTIYAINVESLYPMVLIHTY